MSDDYIIYTLRVYYPLLAVCMYQGKLFYILLSSLFSLYEGTGNTIPYRMKINTEFNLATWLRMVKFTEVNFFLANLDY